MYGAPICRADHSLKVLIVFRRGGGPGRCDVMASKHLGNPGGDVMFRLDETGALGMACRASLGGGSMKADNRGAKSCLSE